MHQAVEQIAVPMYDLDPDHSDVPVDSDIQELHDHDWCQPVGARGYNDHVPNEHGEYVYIHSIDNSTLEVVTDIGVTIKHGENIHIPNNDNSTLEAVCAPRCDASVHIKRGEYVEMDHIPVNDDSTPKAVYALSRDIHMPKLGESVHSPVARRLQRARIMPDMQQSQDRRVMTAVAQLAKLAQVAYIRSTPASDDDASRNIRVVANETERSGTEWRFEPD
jgi:hypothetical protein